MFISTGSAIIDGQRVTCPTEGGHGHVDLTSAFTRSCNVYYAYLSEELGNANMLNTARQFAYNTAFKFPDFNMLESRFEQPGNDGDLAWAGIGQYTDLVTPMHNMLISAGVANGGVVMQPNTLLDVRYGEDSIYNYAPTQYKSIMDGGTAATLAGFMRDTVESGTATSADIGAAVMNGKTLRKSLKMGIERPNKSVGIDTLGLNGASFRRRRFIRRRIGTGCQKKNYRQH